MKKIVIALASVAMVLTSVTGFAQTADDKKWVAQCMKDNKDEGAKESVVKAYCVCMNDKMSDNETRSITEWEKANPKARKECEKVAGWK
jgi:Ni/Co efflux regulator RcnB